MLPLLLSGCSGTPFGEALSRSFSTAPAPSPPPPRAAPPGPPAIARKSPAIARQSPVPDATKPEPPAKPPDAPPVTPPGAPSAAPLVKPPANPAPYRVTILLPQADPAAPAEVLTRALRSAGVPFEVETIQRTVPAAPTVRPAPPPR